MKYTKKRKINTLFGLIPLLVLLFSIVGGVTYAVVTGTRANTEHGFQVNVRGAVKVKATIVGSSSFNEEDRNDGFEVRVDGENVTVVGEDKADFDTGFDFDQSGDKAEMLFGITNNTAEEKYTDLIVDPSYTLEDKPNLVATLYYSTNGEDYEVFDDEYLVIHKGDTIYAKLVVEVLEINLPIVELEGTVDFKLYTEDGLPEGFEYDKKYSVETIDGKEIAKVAEFCPTCGVAHGEAEVMQEGTYVIANDDTTSDNYAQKVIDRNINGKIIVFNGNFTEALKFRPTFESNSDVIDQDSWDSELESEINNNYDLLKEKTTTSYHYRRMFEDVKFVATEGSFFSGKFTLESKWHGDGSYDPMKKYDCQVGHTQLIGLKNVSFENLNFTGATGRLYLCMHRGISENLVVKNCSFTTDTIESDSDVENAAIMITTAGLGEVRNTTFVDNNVEGHAMGIYISNGDTVTVKGNTTKNTRHNGIAVQYTNDRGTTGTVIIENNDISNCLDKVSKTETNPTVWNQDGERAMRIGHAYDATIIIRNNRFNNTYSQIIAATSSTQTHVNYVNTDFKIYNNYYGDIELDHFVATDEMFVITWSL